jgi:predicted metal-dependent HD superfamily phosphohydrolase
LHRVPDAAAGYRRGQFQHGERTDRAGGLEGDRAEIRSGSCLPMSVEASSLNAPSRERWIRLWHDASPHGDPGRWFDELAARYSQPHRHYHNLRHIAECLTEFDAARQLASDPVAVELAIWFHDAVYDPHAPDNEEQSALLAERCLTETRTASPLRAAVSDLVLATKTHDGSGHPDARLLVDLDLSILGKGAGRFCEYETQIRREYDWVPDLVFAAKRAEILEGFLARGRVFVTDCFYQMYEKQARSNLQASLRRLRRTDARQPR